MTATCSSFRLLCIVRYGRHSLALAGCAHQQAENPALSEYPSIQGQIESFYNANATEDDWTCNEVQMENIDKSQVASQSAQQVRVAATYYFTSFDESAGRGGNSAKASTPASSPSTRAQAASSRWC